MWFSFALVSDAIELSSSFHHIWRLFVLDCDPDLDLDMYVAGPFSIYATGRELGMNVSPNEIQLSSLSQHTQHFQDGSSQLSSLGKKEFLNNLVLHCSVLKHLLLFVDCLSIIFLDIQSVKCFDLIWHSPRTGVR